MRITNDILQEIIDNDGCRKGSATPINSTGIVRLCLDLLDARKEIEQLNLKDPNPFDQMLIEAAAMAKRIIALEEELEQMRRLLGQRILE